MSPEQREQLRWHAGFFFSFVAMNIDDPDHTTSMADASIALAIATGASLGDIDPASGDNLSRAAYESCRRSWRNLVRTHGPLTWDTRPGYEGARAYWTERRPQFIDGDDWLAGIAKPGTTENE
ncbi:hypothetical protein AB0D47_20625 [Streptomyces sp. NPDC048376]|uniref:hypothetical protein n=1 Tax=Streptomyces sp. NPDC048376 TaxID=3154926 RepID=UPI00343E7553